jgi:parvulin-like peptidyl-prolyl isomerase
MYKGSRRAADSITRSKDEAKKRAEQCLAKAKAPGAKFDEVVTECTDEPYGAKRGGELGTFAPGMMDPAFSKGVLDTKVGQLSSVVESPFGFHVILRTK